MPGLLAYSTNYDYNRTGKVANDRTLAATAEASWLQVRIPLDRHGATGANIVGTTQEKKKGSINVVFVDGHAENVPYDNFAQVFVSPYR